MSERPTFSPFWHRVRAMSPRLRPHVEITRQHYRGRRWHVVHDPSSNQFYRLNPIAHEFVGLLDGRRTVEEVWKHVLSRHGDAAPTQQEVIQLLSQLYNANLLSADVSPEAEQLLRRGRERLKKKVAQQAIGIMYFRMRLFNPDRFISWVEPMVRPVLNRWGLIAWVVFCLFALSRLLPEWERLVSGVDSAIAPANWGWLVVVFVVTKAIHETGHGVICKRFGGQVPEFGIMLLVLFPAPYVDASACWSFPSKWQRIAVGAGGMIFELLIASIAGLVWLASNEGQLVHSVAYNAMFVASVSTILFNANPLMRFDGYYILSDLLEVPNLMSRSLNMLKFLFQKHAYRIKDAKPPSTIPAEQTILIIYGLAALAYRVFLFITITLYVMGKLFAVGLILAIWTAAAWFIVPIGKFLNWHATSPQLSEFRPRAIATSVVMIGLVITAIGIVPAPVHRLGDGVIESKDRSGVHFGVDAFVQEAHVRIGDYVRAGDPILTCSSDDLDHQIRLTHAAIRELEVLEREATDRSPGGAKMVRDRLVTFQDGLAHLLDQRERLIVRAPLSGFVVNADPGKLVGRYVTTGEYACDIVDPQDVQVVAALTQTEGGWHAGLSPDDYSVQIRRLATPEQAVDGAAVAWIDAAQYRLPHASLGLAGGGTVETMPEDQSGLLAKVPQWVALIEPGGEGPIGSPGERVRVRFTLPSKPLLAQWADRLHKLVQGRVDL